MAKLTASSAPQHHRAAMVSPHPKDIKGQQSISGNGKGTGAAIATARPIILQARGLLLLAAVDLNNVALALFETLGDAELAGGLLLHQVLGLRHGLGFGT